MRKPPSPIRTHPGPPASLSMSPKALPWITGLALAAGLGWYLFAGPAGGRWPEAPTAGPGLRKCERAGAVVYTDAACPPGSHERTVDGTRLSVLPAAPAARPVDAGPPAKTGTVRDLLGKPEDGNLKDQRMDRVIGR
jgi:hypothetical protein